MPDIFDTLEEEPKADIFDQIESEESVPEERPPRGETPADFASQPPIPEDYTSTEREFTDIPRRPFAQTPEEFDVRMAEDIRRGKLMEERAGNLAEAEILANAERAIDLSQQGVVPPSVAEKLAMVGAPALAFAPGIRKSVGEAVSGLTSPVNAGLMLATGAGSAIPKIGAAVARGVAGGFAADIAGHMPELGTAAGEAVGVGTEQEAQKALTDVALSALMGGLAGGGAFHRTAPTPPPIPPRIVETLAKADATGLTKSAQALADVTKQTAAQRAAAAVRETKAATEVTDASSQPKATEVYGDVRSLEKPAEVVPAEVGGERVLPREEPAATGEPARPQGEPKPEVALKPPKGDRLVTVERPDGTTEVVAFGDKYWELGPDKRVASVARWTPAGWSHGMLKAGEKIIEIAKEPEVPKPAETTPLPEPAAQTPKPRAGAAEFNKLVEEYGEQLGWITAGQADALAGLSAAKGGKDSASIAAKIRGAPAKTALRKRAIQELGGDPTKPMTPSELTKLLPKLKERIAKYEADQVAAEKALEDQAAGISGPEIPAGTSTEFLPGDAAPPAATPPNKPFLGKSLDGNWTADQKRTAAGKIALIAEDKAGAQFIWDEQLGGAWIPYNDVAIANKAPAPAVPKLAPGEKGTGDLLKTVEEPLKLVGEKGVDVERVAAEKAAAEKAKAEAAAIQAKQQPGLPGVEPFFERESEVSGLGRSSLPPTVADVRAQRATEQQWQLKPDPAAKHRQLVISKSGSNLGTVGQTPKGEWRVFGDPSPKRFKSAEAAATQLIADLHPELAKQKAYFPRQSEAQGLGEPSLPPTIEDIRAQRATETRERAAAAAKESGFVPDTRGTTEKMRKSAERATESPMIPEPVQERIAEAPESRYRQQTDAKVEDAVKSMTDAELGAVSAESNLYVASKLEQADRLFRAGDNDGGYAIFVELEKQGTSFGQNVNQFKRLKGTRPEHVATVIDKKLEAAGKDPLTPAQRETAIETARKSKEADRELDRATDAWTAKPTAENARRAETALDTANAAAIELQKFVAKFEPRSTSSILKSVLQGNLLTPISEVANLFGNMSFLPFRMGERGVATLLDVVDSAVRGKPRELSVQPLAGTAEALKGVGRGLKQIPDILIEGTGNVIKGETRAGLHPIKAWINQFAKNPEMPTTGGKLTLKDRLNLAIEGTFGVPAEAMLRGLGAGDVPFKEAARARVTAEQLKLANVPKSQWDFAQKFPELFLEKPALEQIRKDTLGAVFQRESKTLNYLTNLAKSKGELLDLMVATVAPYKLTPWNIVGEILSYNPLIAMARGLRDAKAGNTRAAKLNAGKMVVGSMLTGTGIWLYKNGLLAPSLDERDEAQKARVLSGKVLPPNHINVSGLKRAMEGGDPAFKAGDETVDVFRAGGLAGAMLYMTANIGRDMERGPESTDADLWKSILRQSILEQARFGLNQSFLSGVEGLLTSIKEGNADNYLRQWANTAASIVLPNTLNTMSRASRKYQPDVSKDFPARIKSKLGAVTGMDDYLPLKRDFWGEPMLETPEGRDAIFYHFFDISKNKQVTSDPVELELYRLWRKTGSTKVIPSLPEREITVESTQYPLRAELYEKYAELVGKNRREIVDALVINPNFHKLTDEQKMNLLKRSYNDGMERGKMLFWRKFHEQLTPKAKRAGFTQ